MRSIIYWMSLLLVFVVVAQQLNGFKGVVVSSTNSSSIPYVNISIIGTPIGTCSDAKGTFNLRLTSATKADTILVSAIGYETQKIPVSEITDTNNVMINLVEKIYELPEFELEAMKLKKVIEGKKSKNRAWGVMRGENGGAQFGRLFNPKDKNVMIDKVHVRIANAPDCNNDRSQLRLRIYSLEDREKEVDLLHQNIFISIDDTAQWKIVDLSHLEIFTNNRFMIGFEWLFDDFTCPVMVAVGGKGTKSYYRLSSHSEWRPIFDMNWAIKATLLVEE